MPLLRRAPFAPDAAPPSDLAPDEQVFVVRVTGEVFRDYTAYLARLELYRSRDWTCRFTGKTGLTYEEAALSESRAACALPRLPGPYEAAVLRMVQHSAEALDALVDAAAEALSCRYVSDETLHGHFAGAPRDCVVLRDATADEAAACCAAEGAPGAAGGAGEEQGVHHERCYLVAWDAPAPAASGPPRTVARASALQRRKAGPPVARAALRRFVAEAAQQVQLRSGGAVWLVHDPLAAAHGLPRGLPPALAADALPMQLPDGGGGGGDEAPLFAGGGGIGDAEQLAVAAMGDPARRGARRKPAPVGSDAWLRAACAGEIPGVKSPPLDDTAALLALLGPPRSLEEERAALKAGSVKAAVFSVLLTAGAAGMTAQAIVDATQAAGLKDWRTVATPRNSVLNCCMHDSAFCRVADNTYALRALPGVAPAPPPPPRLLGAAAEGEGGEGGRGGSGGNMPPESVGRAARAERAARAAVAALQARGDAARHALADARAAASRTAAAAADAAMPDADAAAAAAPRRGKRSVRGADLLSTAEAAASKLAHLESEAESLAAQLATANAQLAAAEARHDAARRAAPAAVDDGGGGGGRAEAARARESERARSRYPMDDDALLAQATSAAAASGAAPPLQRLPPPPPLPPPREPAGFQPHSLGAAASEALLPAPAGASFADECAVVAFLGSFGTMLGVRPLGLPALDAALRRADGGSALPSLYLSLLCAALRGGAEKTVFGARWLRLAGSDTWPEIARRVVAWRAATGLEGSHAAAAAAAAAALPIAALPRGAHAALLRALCDAALDTDTVTAAVTARLDDAAALARRRADAVAERRKQQRAASAAAAAGFDDEDEDDARAAEEDARVALRLTPLGEDRARCRYWYRLAGTPPHTLYVEQPDGEWGAIRTPAALDALISALNPKGVREKALKAALEAERGAMVAAMAAPPAHASSAESAALAALAAAVPPHPLALAAACDAGSADAGAAARVWRERESVASAAMRVAALGRRFVDAHPAAGAWHATWHARVVTAGPCGDVATLRDALLEAEAEMFSLAEKPSRFSKSRAAPPPGVPIPAVNGVSAPAPAAAAAAADDGDGDDDGDNAPPPHEAGGVDDGVFPDWAEPNLSEPPTRGRQVWQTVSDRILWRNSTAGTAAAPRLAYAAAVLTALTAPLLRALAREAARVAAGGAAGAAAPTYSAPAWSPQPQAALPGAEGPSPPVGSKRGRDRPPPGYWAEADAVEDEEGHVAGGGRGRGGRGGRGRGRGASPAQW